MIDHIRRHAFYNQEQNVDLPHKCGACCYYPTNDPEWDGEVGDENQQAEPGSAARDLMLGAVVGASAVVHFLCLMAWG